MVQTLALAASQVLASALDQYFQLTIMLMVLVVGAILLAHLTPFQARLAQTTQVFGFFTVLATATGCLYFTDSGGVASRTGQDAAGILLLLLNAGFVL